MTERDYITEMDECIKEATGNWGTTAAVVAAKLHARLAESDPDLLEGWLHAMAVPLLRRVIGLRSARLRRITRLRAGAAEFASAAADFGESDGGAEAAARFVGMFRNDYVVDDKDTRKLVPDMTGPDHLFVASHQYEREARNQRMLAAFHRAVAKKIGKRRTGDVLSERQYEELYRSIVRGAA